MSVARKILREKEQDGTVVPYIKESGFVVYTTPSELEKQDSVSPKMLLDELEAVASSVPKTTIIDDEMDVALAAAATLGAVKPSKLARMRREAGEKKERKDKRPEVIVEPLDVPEVPPQPEPEAVVEPPKKTASKKTTKKAAEEKPKKKTTKKTTKKAAEEKPKKATAKKTTKKAAEEKPKKAAAKKTTKKAAEEKPKKTTAKKTTKKA
ncbi:MAG: hypothetical protein DRP09_01545, partial [Candidatus Thorarchaeota archaeon]